MAYFKIGDKDFSAYVKQLKIFNNPKYNLQTNAAGNSVVDYINSKRTIDVVIVPVNDAVMWEIRNAIKAFGVSISFLNPDTRALEENVACIAQDTGVDYYTIQSNKVLYKTYNIKFTEL